MWPLPISFLVIISTIRLWRRTPLDLPLLIFLGAALIGLWAAYDRGPALQKFWLLLGAYLLFYAITIQPPQNLWTVVALLAGLGAIVAIFFLLTTDWHTYPPKFALTRRLLYSWASVRPSLDLLGLHPNVAGSLIALLLPFQLASIRHLRQQQERARAQRAIMLAGATLSALALLLSSSRGAILSLAAGLMLWALWQRATRFSPALQRIVRRSIYVLAAALVAVLAIIFTYWYSQPGSLLAQLPMGASLVERATLAAQTLNLIIDFPIIGGGLASFPGLYSRYILGIPYFYLPNAHNILLDILLEQGPLGAISFILIAVATIRWLLPLANSARNTSNGQTKLLAGAAFSSFVVLLLHGMVENTVYGSVGLPLLLITPAMAIALNRATHGAGAAWQRPWSRLNAFALAGCGVLLLATLLLPTTRALWLNNLASIQMARVELARFPRGHWLENSDTTRLASAQRMFEHSIRLNRRQNRAVSQTAQYRLGLIAMARHDYQEAANRLQLAYEDANGAHIGIRKALGYSYAWSGNVEEGIVLLSQAPLVNQDLRAYENWWQSQGRSDLGSIAAQVLERIEAAEHDNPLK